MSNNERRTVPRRHVLTATGGLAIAGLAGCLGGEDEPEDIDVEEFEVIDRDDDSVPVYVHGDHWHGDPLLVPHGDNLSLGADVEDEDGDTVELGDGIELEVHVADGAQEGIVESDPDEDFHGDHVHLYGEEEGFTDIVFQLTEDGEVVYESPELEVEVGDDHDHDHDHGSDDVDELVILDRAEDPHEEVADYHDGHWHGELPHIHPGDNVSLGGEFYDHDEHEIHIGHDEEYELGVRVADDAEEGIVSIDEDEDFHGDHVHIHGEEEGETEVVFMLWHDDHADWETEPIAISVDDH
ncbi:hypothetical protein OB905_02155 [Halobacteria archaeon AArc-dxtr1]|nr:hypothetical protein [Halobacteria archaeon AArc-dxtr1]